MSDEERVEQLLGRRPRGAFEVAAWDASGDPVVIRNAPLLDDGTPMPTRFWLVGPALRRAVDQLEAAGGVRQAEAAVDPAELRRAHDRYAAERDAAIPAGWSRPRPSGGVGGTRRGVKCLHAHLAYGLAGGTDPIAAWVTGRIEPPPVVRPAVPGDVGPIRDLEAAAGEMFRPLGLDAVADDDPPPAPVLEACVTAGRCWVVSLGSRLGGYVLAETVDGCAHVMQVSVHPDVARRRLGAALIERVAAWARGCGLAGLTLTTFAEVPWNGPYYRRLGFRTLGAGELGPVLAARLDQEVANGLDAWPRVAMGRDLDGGGPGGRR